jgi:predicted extracellular nuclease
MKLICSSTLATLVALVGCRDSGGQDTPPDGPPAATDNKIQDVQNDAVADGTKIKLSGVIVTAVDNFGARTGNFYVQEPEGGPFSGVLVFGAKVSDVAALSVGDVVNLDGMEKDEFLPPNDATGRTITELKPVSGGTIAITKVSGGVAPAPAVVDLAAIAELPQAMAEAEMEKWEGVLITIKDVTQLNNPRPASSTDNTFLDFTGNGGLIVDTSLTAFPATALAGACYASVTGMGDYFYNYKVVPRSAADFAAGTSCPGPRVATVAQIQLDSYAKTGLAPSLVYLKDVYVTATTANTGNFRSVWVAQSLTAAVNEGVQVFLGATNIPPGTVPGAKVDVLGSVVEYDNNGSTGDKLTEVTRATVRVTAAPAALPTPIPGVSLATLGAIGAAGEPYEGTLVRTTGLKISAIGANDITLVDNAAPPNTVVMDNDIFAYVATDFAVDACYSSIDGIASLNTLDDKRTLLPRSAADLVIDATGAACAPVP